MLTLIVKKQTVLLDDTAADRIKKEFGSIENIEVREGKDKWYAIMRRTKNGKRETVSVARFLMNIVNDTTKVVSFKDKNPLNLQRRNMIVTERELAMKGRSSSQGSSSKYLGVSWSARNNKWRVTIKPSAAAKNKHIGLYADEDEAALAYNTAAKKYHGKHANLNVVK